MQDEQHGPPSKATLIFHSLAPAPIGVLCYILLGVLLIGMHMLGLSLSGTAFPESFDDNLLQGYANFIIQPLAQLVNNNFFNSGLTLVVWGVAGWMLCALVASVATAFNDWRNTEKDIATPREGTVVRHPLQRNLLIRLLWRLLMGILIVLYTAAILPVVRYCLGNDVLVLQTSSFVTGAYITAFTTFVWMAVFHIYVILFRLYVLRTRLVGEIIY